MAKQKTVWICSECGNESPKWAGQCPSCKAWGTLQEMEKTAPLPGVKMHVAGKSKPLAKASEHSSEKKQRITCGIGELDRVLGGGMMQDGLVLLTGDPGIGKSTLALQWAIEIAKKHPKEKVMIVSGEESLDQIGSRAKRLGNVPENLFLISEYLLENIIVTVEVEKPHFLILDSVQTIASSEIASLPGSVSQVRFVTEKMMHLIKALSIPTVLIGHVTKSGDMAGPQTLAHLVDTILYLEGDRFHQFRLLRSTKNRFGSVFEVGIFEMMDSGLQEVKNPSEAFLSGRLQNAIGSIIFPTIEGTRPLLVEVQSLVSVTQFGYPKRTATGIDINRLNLILAILQKHAGIKLDNYDVFANVIGGFRLKEPALDLPLALSLASSKLKKPLPSNLTAMGELGLSGEIRAISHLEKRLQESEKLGFTTAVVPNAKVKKSNMNFIQAKTISELIKIVFS